MRYLIIFLLVAGCIPAINTMEPYRDVQPPQVVELKITGVDSVQVAEECGDGIFRSMEIKNPEGQLSSMMFVSDDTAHFKLFSYIGSLDSTNLWQDIIILKSRGINKLNVYINSGGGSAYDGLALADTLTFARKQGFIVTAHVVGVCASAAVPVFSAAEFRYATESAQFMVHPSKLGKYIAYEGTDELKTQQIMLEQLRRKYIGLLVKGSNLSYDEWEDKVKSTTYFSAAEAMEWNLVHEIR